MCITKKVADSLSYPQKHELLQWNEAGEKWEDDNPFSITEMDTADYMKKKGENRIARLFKSSVK